VCGSAFWFRASGREEGGCTGRVSRLGAQLKNKNRELGKGISATKRKKVSRELTGIQPEGQFDHIWGEHSFERVPNGGKGPAQTEDGSKCAS